jgi:hypothetical protein
MRRFTCVVDSTFSEDVGGSLAGELAYLVKARDKFLAHRMWQPFAVNVDETDPYLSIMLPGRFWRERTRPPVRRLRRLSRHARICGDESQAAV